MLILPGFTVSEYTSAQGVSGWLTWIIVCASLELSHKKMLTGSIKLVYAIFFTMILVSIAMSFACGWIERFDVL